MDRMTSVVERVWKVKMSEDTKRTEKNDLLIYFKETCMIQISNRHPLNHGNFDRNRMLFNNRDGQSFFSYSPTPACQPGLHVCLPGWLSEARDLSDD